MDDPRARQLAEIVRILEEKTFGAKCVIEVDSIICMGLFGQRTKKKNEKRQHDMQTLSRNCMLDQETGSLLYETFEAGKQKLSFADPTQYMSAARDIAKRLYRGSRTLKAFGDESRTVSEWCIAAYSMTINPASAVKLSCIGMGQAGTLGFAVHATRPIPAGQRIYELVGLMPNDNRWPSSDVSRIKPSRVHNQSSRVERVLFGPIRFINHVCATPNAEFIAICDTSAFGVLSTRGIEVGEELLVDYGPAWFASEPGGCPCRTCKPDLQTKKRALEEKDAETVREEKRQARKKKKLRTKEKKRAYRQQTSGG